MSVIEGSPIPVDYTFPPVAGYFYEALFQFLSADGIEGFKNYVYADSRGIPTLGVGYALVTGSAGNWSIRQGLFSELRNAGIDLNSTQLNALLTDLDSAVDALNQPKSGITNPFVSGVNLGWTITASQADALFQEVIPQYINNIQAWLGNSPTGKAAFQALYNDGYGSRELIALTSQAYNGTALISPGHSPHLRQAILDGNRAEAWYQIRYNDPKPALRRYAEAAMFGLYNYGETGTSVTKEEALQIYQMCTAHGGLHCSAASRATASHSASGMSGSALTTRLQLEM